MVKIIFTRGEAPYLYADALHLTEDEHASLAPEAIEQMKDARYEAWYLMVTALSEEGSNG